MRSYTEKERKKFRDFAESLKLVRNANLEDPSTGENLIDNLYTDLLPNNGIIDKVNLAKTTIIVGRKGTGKSTIFQKSINAIQQKDETMCIYIDVKSLVENTSIPPIYHSESAVVSHEDLRRYLTYVEFLRIIINKTKEKINEKLSSLSLFEKFFGHDNYKLGKVIEKLNKIEKSSADAFKKIDLTLLEYIKSVEDNDTDIKLANEVELAANPKIKFKGEFKNKSEIKKEFQNIIGTYIDIRGTLINNLIEIRELLSLKDIYILR
jgi:hypothetical protein